MKKHIIFILAALFTVVLLPLVAGCSFSFTTATLSEGTMAMGVTDDNRPVDPTTVFTAGTNNIYCSVKLSNAPEDTVIDSVWIYVSGEVEGLTDYEIDRHSVTTDGTRYIQFSLSNPDEGFPGGDYKLVLYIDGKESMSLPFKIE